jgi:hypothetical protein
LIAIKVVLDKEGETERLYFVRVEEGEPLTQNEVVSSNYFEDGYVYLLNPEPGRYVAVAAAKLTQAGHAPGPAMVPVGGGVSVGASFNPGPRESVTFFPASVVQGTFIEVRPGSVAFMGAWVLSTPWSPGIGDDADAVQSHYSRLMEHQGIGTSHRLGSEQESDRSDAALFEFLPYARKRLAGKGWSRIIDDSAGATSGSFATGMETISGISLTCKKPFAFERDCSNWSGPKRRIEVRGFEAKIAGSADGRTVVVMNASVWRQRIFSATYKAVETELRSHGVGIRRVTAISMLGRVHGYILELDGDGYSILEALSE